MAKIDHNKQHAIDSSTDHTSSILEDNLVSADANGLPKDAGVASNNVKKHNFSATAYPVETDDIGSGYSVGSMWWFASARKLFICFDTSTGSAVWKLVASDGLVSNKTGSIVPQLYAVYPGTPQGGFPTINLAKADAEPTSSKTRGVILEDISINGKGYIVNNTQVYNVDGSGNTFGEVWSVGDTLWVSATTAGYLTKTKPASPYHATKVGMVISNHATQGILEIQVQNGWETTEIHDISDTLPATNEFLLFNGSIYAPTNFDTEVSANSDVTNNTTNGIHGNAAGEITAITEITTNVCNDEILVEDSSDSNNKKSIKLCNVAVGKTQLGVRNETGTTIPANRAVYMTGFNGYPLVALGDNTNIAKTRIIGITKAAIDHESNGTVVTSGRYSADTDSYSSVGVPLYLTTSGVLSETAPSTGVHLQIGQVTVKSISGEILLLQNTAIDYLAAANGQDIDIRMGDSAGTNKVSFEDSTDAEVASIDSDGNISAAGTISATGAVTGSNLSGTNTGDEVAASTTTPGVVELAISSEIDTGTDTTRAMPVDQFVASKRNLRHFSKDIVHKDIAVVAAPTTSLFSWECPVSGTILQSDSDTDQLKAVAAVAGTTGTMVVDIHLNGTTIMTTNKLNIETGETSSKTATTQPDLTTTSVTKGDVFTFYVDSIQTTAAFGCTVYMTIRES